MKKFLARFVEEAGEHIEKANRELLGLEKDPDDVEMLSSVFRSVHTLKGSSRMMKLTPISEVAHKLEEILGALRERQLALSRELSDLLFEGLDAISGMVESLRSGDRISKDIEPICTKLENASKGGLTAMTPADVPRPAPGDPRPAPCECSPTPAVEENGPAPRQPDHGGDKPSHRARALEGAIRVDAAKLDSFIKLSGEMASCHGRSRQRLLDAREIEKLAERIPEVPSHLANGNSEAIRAVIADQLRPLVTKLKELVFEFNEDLNAQDNLIREFMEKALWMRMLPLSTLFDSFHRTVRDIAGSLGKKAELFVEGSDTMLDKKMIEGIGDPLVHMIRNALDHGIEGPEERIRAGKAETGAVRLMARHDGDSVVITLSDDGSGIPLAKIKEKALQKKIVSPEELENIPESRLTDLIFHPGLSTSRLITDISGRGVGMDVVKRNIVDNLKGAVHVETKEGEGTTFEIRLLLTLATMDVLLVTAGGNTFALPAGAVSRIHRVPRSEIIDVVDKKAIRLREHILQVVDLGEVLGLPVRAGNPERDLLILVLSDHEEKMGLMVESVIDEENVVVNPLPAHLRDNRLVAGVATLGKNEAVSILNGSEIIRTAREVRYERRVAVDEADRKKVVHILVVDDSRNTREIEKSILEAYGYDVTLAADGIEALEKTRGFRYDLIVTDIEMPRLDGFSLTERLRGDEEYKDTPIVLVTSRDRESDKRRGLQVGADAYIIKGAFDQSNLLDTIRDLVG